MSVTALSFDIVMIELLLPLISGGAVEFLGPFGARDPERLRERLERGDVRFMQGTPTLWSLVVEAGWRGGLDIAVTAGEALPLKLAQQLMSRARKVWNLYGPTEATIYATGVEVTRDWVPGSIGKPLANMQAYVVDEDLRLASDGAEGELLIGGAGVALGYHHRPELDGERFIPDMFRRGEGRRLYRTGDRVRRLPDGALLFLGRRDDQVKLHGLRIELGEVEAAIESHPAVAQAVVVPVRDDGKVRRLAAFWVAREALSEALSAADFRRHATQRLPTSLAPATMTMLEVMPRTPSGKVDRIALAQRAQEGDESARAEAPAIVAAMASIGALWRQVLRVPEVEGRDNFFDLGGASMDAIQFVSVARKAGWAVEIADIFRHQTLAALVAELASRPRDARDAPVFERVAVPQAILDRQGELSRTRSDATLAAGRCRSRIESLGVYLPDRRWTTADVLAGCRKPLDLDLEKLTGIATRPRASEREFAIDIAANAVAQCLARSRHGPEDIDLIICCNISRFDAPRQIGFEPSSSARLRDRFGLRRARAFDVNNACPGVFTGLRVADLYLRSGTARRALVVSGEYITHLTDTAQLEIEGPLDPRMACLTLGDSGVAMVVEPCPDGETGFHEIDLFTLGEHSELCIGGPTDKEHGGAIMLTDPLGLSDVALREGMNHSLALLDRLGVAGVAFQHFIMHQTSSATIRNAMRELALLMGPDTPAPQNFVDNLAERGNTSTTSHFVALSDEMARGRVRPGDRILFSISGSGMTLGTALYTMDDLPLRMAGAKPKPRDLARRDAAPWEAKVSRLSANIAASAILELDDPALGDTLTALEAVAAACLTRAGRRFGEVDLLICAGVHRTGFICEPSTASRLAGRLSKSLGATEDRIFAFDLLNGGLGLLEACDAASQWLSAREARTALVVAAEVNPNRAGRSVGLRPGATALLIEPSFDDDAGFGAAGFAQIPHSADVARAYCTWDRAGPYLVAERSSEFEAMCLDGLADLLPKVLAADGVGLGEIDFIIPPHPSAHFHDHLAKRLGVGCEKLAGVEGVEGDLLSCSPGYGLESALRRGLVRPGARGLILAAAAGVQVACAAYRW